MKKAKKPKGHELLLPARNNEHVFYHSLGQSNLLENKQGTGTMRKSEGKMKEYRSPAGYTLQVQHNFQENSGTTYRICWQHPEEELGLEGLVGGSYDPNASPPDRSEESWEVWVADQVARSYAAFRDMHGFIFNNRNDARRAHRAICRKLREEFARDAAMSQATQQISKVREVRFTCIHPRFTSCVETPT